MIELLDKIKQLDKQKLAALIAALVIVLVLDATFVMQWQLKSAGRAKEKALELKSAIAETERNALDVARKQREGNKSVAKVKTVVNVNDLTVLLQKVATVAKEHNVKVNQISHVKEAKIVSSRPGQPAQPQAQGLIPVSIRLDLVAGYHDFGRFLNTLENAEEPMAAQEIRFSTERAELSKLRINLILKTFVKG